jgi:hypothetical protein
MFIGTLSGPLWWFCLFVTHQRKHVKKRRRRIRTKREKKSKKVGEQKVRKKRKGVCNKKWVNKVDGEEVKKEEGTYLRRRNRETGG